jgi:hypothetical protein
MEILRQDENLNIILNKEQDNLNDLGWQDNMIQFEDEVLTSIINPIDNYETVRFIHKPYNTSVGGLSLSQTDIWFYFYFSTGGTYVPDYNVVGIDTHENAKMLKATTKSFFRLEFFKTPITEGVVEPPSRINRKLVFAKNLSLPLGEKYFYNGNNINENIHFPIFMGSNYKNKENMYLFWFQDESVLSGTVLSGDTFFMTAKFYNAEDGGITDFVNDVFSPSKEIVDTTDMYYKVVIDRTDYSYQIYNFNGTTGSLIGKSDNPIKFYEKGGGTLFVPTLTPTPTPTITATITPTPTLTVTPTPTKSSGGMSYPAIDFSLTSVCVGYNPTGATITVSGATGGSGSGYYCVMTSGPVGFDTSQHSLPFTYTGLNSYVGNTYAVSVYDSVGNGGNKALTQDLTCNNPPNVSLTVRFQYIPDGTAPSVNSWSGANQISVELSSSTGTFCSTSSYKSSSFTPYGQGNNLWIYDGTYYRRLFHTTGGGNTCVPASGCNTY